MATECGVVFLAILTLDNGKIAKLMAMVSINGRMEIVTKEAGSIASNMIKDLTSSPMVMYILETMPLAKPMVKASTNGKTEAFTKENSRKA